MQGWFRTSSCLLPAPQNDTDPGSDLQLRRDDLYVNTSTGKIISGQDYFFSARKPVDRTIDLDGRILAPGYIDAQINGAYGKDFSCYDEGEVQYLSDLDYVSETIVETGTTSYVPTIITQRSELYSTVSDVAGR